MSYEIVYSTQARKTLGKLPMGIARRITEKLESTLSENPVPQNAEATQGVHGTFRVRIGGYRGIYIIRHETQRILVFKIDKRSRVYD